MPKKDGKVRMCVDYRDLNRAIPKDDFPLPHIDVLVDNTAQHKVFSFMDGLFEVFLAKVHDGNELAKSKCRIPCFVQFNGDSVFDDVWNLVGLCFSLGLMFRMSTITLLKVVFAAMCVGVTKMPSFL